MWEARQENLEPFKWISPKSWNLWERFKFVWGTKFLKLRLPSSIKPRLFIGVALLFIAAVCVWQKMWLWCGVSLVLGGIVLWCTLSYRRELRKSIKEFHDLDKYQVSKYQHYMKAQLKGDYKKPNPLITTSKQINDLPLYQLDALVDPKDGLFNEESKGKLKKLVQDKLVDDTGNIEKTIQWAWRWDVVKAIDTVKTDEEVKVNTFFHDGDGYKAYNKLAWTWWNGAWVNFWRLFLVSSLFHFVAVMLTASSVDNTPEYCEGKKDAVPDKCAFYTMLERYNLIASLSLTLIIFVVLLLAGKHSKICRDIVGTEDVKADGEWWQVMSDNSVFYALGTYLVVFAGIAHGGAVGYVQNHQIPNLRDSAIHQSFSDNPAVARDDNTVDKEKIKDAEAQKSIVQYAMYNDIASNVIMIMLLAFIVPYVEETIWEPAKAAREAAKKAAEQAFTDAFNLGTVM